MWRLKKSTFTTHTHTHKLAYLCFITCLLIFQIKRLNGYSMWNCGPFDQGFRPPPFFFSLKEVWISRLLKYLISLLLYTDELCCPKFYFLNKHYISFCKYAFFVMLFHRKAHERLCLSPWRSTTTQTASCTTDSAVTDRPPESVAQTDAITISTYAWLPMGTGNFSMYIVNLPLSICKHIVFLYTVLFLAMDMNV